MSEDPVISARLMRIRRGRNVSRASILGGGLLVVVVLLIQPTSPAFPPVMVCAAMLILVAVVYGAKFGFIRCPKCGNRFFQRRWFGPNLFWYTSACMHCGIRL